MAATAAAAGAAEYVDTHCHVDEVLTQLGMAPPYDEVVADREAVWGKGCCGVVAQFCDPAAFSPSFGVYPELLKLDGVYGAFGLHPHHARHWSEPLASRIMEALAHPRAVALGEIGLDYKQMRSTKEEQLACFRAQLEIALGLERALPVVLHCAKAEADMLAMLLEVVPAARRADLVVHLHCFTGTGAQAKAFLEAFPRLFIGVTGFVTFGSGAALRAGLSSGDIPLGRLLLETDGPHMTPEAPEDGGGADTGARGRGRGDGGRGGRRGGGRGGGRRRGRGGRKPNTPQSIPAIAAAVAALVGAAMEDVLRQTRENARTVYGV